MVIKGDTRRFDSNPYNPPYNPSVLFHLIFHYYGGYEEDTRSLDNGSLVSRLFPRGSFRTQTVCSGFRALRV